MSTKSIKFLFVACSLCCGGAAALALTACADWDDHYDANKALLDSQQSTLWQNIEKSGNLSQFATLLKKAGYDEVLNTSQCYTVWAPANGTFDYETLSSLADDRLQKEFIENHIARNNYPASGQYNQPQRIYTLNEKLMYISGGNGNYAIQGISVAQPNLASENGTIHILDGKIPFKQNIYESLNNYEFTIDSISNFFHSYDVRKLNEYKSIQGPTLNGEITYLDSIFDESNDLFRQYFAYINREDSNYSMVLPTNEAWIKAKETVSKYYNYLPSFEFMENTSTGSDQKKVKVNIKDINYLKDSIVNIMLTSSLFFNNNIYDNRKLDSYSGSGSFVCDSLYATTGMKIYREDAARLLEGTRRLERSNGYVWLTDDSLRMRTWSVWNPEIKIQAENTAYIASTSNVYNNEPQRIYVAPGTQNPAVTGSLSANSYLEVQSVSTNTNQGVVFYLPDVRSTTYSIYMVMVPAVITSTNNPAKPNRFTVTMGYAKADGTNEDSNRSWISESAFVNDSLQIDTVYLGDFTFPMAYYGTGNYYPYLRVNSYIMSRDRNLYDRTLRIDCIILRPKELDDYLKAHPDYLYDQGNY